MAENVLCLVAEPKTFHRVAVLIIETEFLEMTLTILVYFLMAKKCHISPKIGILCVLWAEIGMLVTYFPL